MPVSELEQDSQVEKTLKETVHGYITMKRSLALLAPSKESEWVEMCSSYLNYRASQRIEKLTEELTRWNRILAISTALLATFTSALAFVTYLRG